MARVRVGRWINEKEDRWNRGCRTRREHRVTRRRLSALAWWGHVGEVCSLRRRGGEGASFSRCRSRVAAFDATRSCCASRSGVCVKFCGCACMCACVQVYVEKVLRGSFFSTPNYSSITATHHYRTPLRFPLYPSGRRRRDSDQCKPRRASGSLHAKD